jgi:Flp pilus assembly protein TadB
MCFDALHNGDATERPLGDLLRSEAGSAARTTGIATAITSLFLLVSGVGLPVVAAAALVAVAVGFALHLTVLVAGVCLVRWRARTATRRQSDRATP